MKQAQVVGPWVGAGTADDPFRPQLADDYTLREWSDATGQAADTLPGDPNLFVVWAVMEDAVLVEIETDPAYQVLWSE